MIRQWLFLICAALLALGGCATEGPKDYTAFKANRPASILILPPVNSSLEVDAPFGVLAQATMPIAEAGYYVFPVAIVYETFKQNGLTNPADIHQVPLEKLREIFGADAVLYMDVKQYGASYAVFASNVTVGIDATLVSTHTGETLWAGHKTVVDGGSSGAGGLIGMLIEAIVNQIANTLTDRSFGVAGTANLLLFSPAIEGGLITGPRYPEQTP